MLTMFFALGSVRDIFRTQVEARKRIYAVSTEYQWCGSASGCSPKVHTIEHIGATPIGARLQQAWLKIDVMQCGYCQAGQIMSACALLGQIAQPTTDQINSAMAGNICRCGCYNRIRSAIQIAAGMKEESTRDA